MIEGSGSVHLTNGSGSVSRRPKKEPAGAGWSQGGPKTYESDGSGSATLPIMVAVQFN
jgi:hypothetical protein